MNRVTAVSNPCNSRRFSAETEQIPLKHPPNSVHAALSVRVTPRAKQDALAGWSDGVLRVRLAAPPVDGKANAALCRFLAGRLGVPVRAVQIVGGETARDKRLWIEGIDHETLIQRLTAPP